MAALGRTSEPNMVDWTDAQPEVDICYYRVGAAGYLCVVLLLRGFFENGLKYGMMSSFLGNEEDMSFLFQMKDVSNGHLYINAWLTMNIHTRRVGRPRRPSSMLRSTSLHAWE